MKFYKPKFWDKRGHISLFSILLLPLSIIPIIKIYFENNKKVTQKAISNLKIIRSSEDYTFLELNPITGRKHQLRKQLLNIGYPIVGDDKYFLNNGNRIKTKSLMLHAYKIKFMINNVQYNFKANYDNIFEDFLKKNI